MKTFEAARRCVPFIIIPLGLYLLTNGRVQNGAGYSGTLQLGDAHHGSIYSSELCALNIFLYNLIYAGNQDRSLYKIWYCWSIVLVGICIMVMGSRNGLFLLRWLYYWCSYKHAGKRWSLYIFNYGIVSVGLLQLQR